MNTDGHGLGSLGLSVLVLVLVRSAAALVLNMRDPCFRDRVQLAYACLSVATRRHVTASDANPRSHGATNSQSRNATACVVAQLEESTAQVRGQRFCRCDQALKVFYHGRTPGKAASDRQAAVGWLAFEFSHLTRCNFTGRSTQVSSRN